MVGAALPNPTLPSEYGLAFPPIINADPGPIAKADYVRSWSFEGRRSTKRSTVAYIVLRVHAHQRDVWGLPAHYKVPLADDVEANAVSPLALRNIPVRTFIENISWTYKGVDYELGTFGITPHEILTVINSLL